MGTLHATDPPCTLFVAERFLHRSMRFEPAFACRAPECSRFAPGQSVVLHDPADLPFLESARAPVAGAGGAAIPAAEFVAVAFLAGTTSSARNFPRAFLEGLSSHD